MDLKFKGKAWVGNIFQKFEAMCQEVDDFVSQDTVKYVENQVQTVGENVKKFCSDVVQDLLPPSVNAVKCDEKEGVWKKNDSFGAYVRSMIETETKPVYIDRKQLSAAQDPLYHMESCHVSQLSLPAADPLKEMESDLSEPDNDPSIYKHSDASVVESIMKEERFEESSSHEDKNLSEGSSSSKSIDENHKDEILAKVSPATSAEITDLRNIEEEGTICNRVPGEVECKSNVSSSSLSSELKCSVVSPENIVAETSLVSSSSSVSYEYFALSESELLNASLPHKTQNICCNPSDSAGCIFDLSLSLSSSKSSPNDEVAQMEHAFSGCVLPFDFNVSSTQESSELIFSAESCENKVAEKSFISSSSSLSTESCGLSELLDTNVTNKPENSCCNPSDRVGCISDLSFALSSSESHPTVECDDEVARVKLTFSGGLLPHESTGKTEEFSTDGANPSMETTDLSDKVKLDESCVIVDDKLLYAFACRAVKFRSYKKIIQDAFASKKRLIKEYKQLGIWYGDVDMALSQHLEQSLLPSLPAEYSRLKKPTPHDLCDSEWELL